MFKNSPRPNSNVRRKHLSNRRARQNLQRVFRRSNLESLERRELLVASLSVDDILVIEGDSALFTVTLSEPAAQQITVDYSTVAGTAAVDEDFQATSGTIVFDINDTSKTVGVSTTENSVGNFSRSFSLALSNPQGADLSDDTGWATILDDELSPAATISGPTLAVPGMPLNFELAIENLSPEAAAQNYTYHIDWENDGIFEQQVTGLGSGLEVEYTFNSALGSKQPTVFAVNASGGATANASTTISVVRTALLGNNAYFGGTQSDDSMIAYVSSTRVQFRLESTYVGTYTIPAGGHVVMYGLAGDDSITVSGSSSI